MMIERPADDTFKFLNVCRDFTEIHHDVTFAQSFTINIRLGFFHNMSETFQKLGRVLHCLNAFGMNIRL